MSTDIVPSQIDILEIVIKNCKEFSDPPKWGFDLNGTKSYIDLLPGILKLKPFRDTSFLNSAIRHGNVNFLDIMFNQNNVMININEFYDLACNSPLHFATSLHDDSKCNVIGTLLKYGANPNIKNCFSETPLGNAVFYRDVRKFKNDDIINNLLSNGGDPSLSPYIRTIINSTLIDEHLKNLFTPYFNCK